MKKNILGLYLFWGLLISLLVGGILYSLIKVPSSGNIRAIGIKAYNSSDCLIEITKIDWGIIDAGSNVSRTIWLKLEGNVRANISITTNNWIPQNASQYIILSYSDIGLIEPDTVCQVILTLSVSEDIWKIYSFSFDIIIVATEC